MKPESLRLALLVPLFAIGVPAWLPAHAQDGLGCAYGVPVIDEAPATRAEIRAATRTGEQALAATLLSDAALDEVRGGFSTDSGLQISFGIERAVYINGELVTTTAFTVGNLGATSAGAARSVDPGHVLTVQNGVGNLILPGTASGQGAATVIQNSLDAQKIQSLTVINAATNSLQVLKGMQVQTHLNDAIAASLRR